MFTLDSSARSTTVQLDDPDYPLQIERSSDFQAYRSRAREKEPWTYEWLKDFDSNTLFYDVGACVGSYSLMAAARGATVIAFEPLRENVRGLVQNIHLNNLADNVTIVESAVSDQPLSMHVHDAKGGLPAGYGLGSLLPVRNQTKEVEVMTVTLDAAAELYGYPTHIKIDVEGAEDLVLISGLDVLNKVQSVIVEIADDDTERYLGWLMASGGLTGREVGNRRTMEQRTKVYER